jgi:HSP20 family protein
MTQPREEKNYHSFLRTFYGDFMDIETCSNNPQLTVPLQTNVVETKNSYRIQVALPGYARDQIRLQVNDDVLLITAEGKIEEIEQYKIYHRQEIFSSSFQRSILLPEDINDNDIKARFNDGLLNIELPKSDRPVRSSLEISIR